MSDAVCVVVEAGAGLTGESVAAALVEQGATDIEILTDGRVVARIDPDRIPDLEAVAVVTRKPKTQIISLA